MSVDRPVITTCASCRSASTIGRAPMYALALCTRSSTVESGSPVSMFLSSTPRASSSGSRSRMSSPLIIATRARPPRPTLRASSNTASRQPAGFTPPALAMTRMPRSTTAGRMSPISGTKSRAYPACGLRLRCFCMIDMVTSAR